MAAVDQHGKFREDPWGRLERTTQLRARHDLRRHRRGRSRVRAGAQGARAHPRRRPGHRAQRTRPTIPTCCSGSTRSRSSRSCSSTARTRAASSRRRRRSVRRRDGARRRDGGAPAGHGAADRWASCASTCGRCAALAGHARRVRRPARRAVPADGPQVPPAVGDPDHRRDRDPARRTRAACTGIPWFPPAALPVRTAVFALSRVLNLVTPTPPSLREARERMSGQAA